MKNNYNRDFDKKKNFKRDGREFKKEFRKQVKGTYPFLYEKGKIFKNNRYFIYCFCRFGSC